MVDQPTASQQSDFSVNESLLTLLDSVIEHHKQDGEQLLRYLEELKGDKRLRATSIVLRTNGFYPSYTMLLTFDNLQDSKIWAQCLCTAIDKLAIVDEVKLAFDSAKITATVQGAAAKTVLQFLDPLYQRTHCDRTEFESSISFEPVRTLELNDEPLQNLIDLVEENHKNEMEQLVLFGEELKNDPTRRLEINFLKIRIEKCEDDILPDYVDISFLRSIKCAKSRLMWRACIVSVMNKLNIAPISTSRWLGYFDVTMSYQQFENVLLCMKPLASRLSIEYLEFGSFFSGSSVLENSTDFFEPGTIDRVWFQGLQQSDSANFEPALSMIQKVKPANVFYERPYSANEIHEFILPLADIVESISIGENGSASDTVHPVPFHIVKHMLSRKCNALDIQRCYMDEQMVSLNSIAEVEELVQLFHNKGEKITLSMPTNLNFKVSQIGEYHVETYHDNEESIHTIDFSHILM